jgi:hypothetical protein
MVSPVLAKKTSETLTLNERAKKIFQVVYQSQVEKDDGDAQKIMVSALVSKVAFFYEKIRNAVDYEEEHLLRRNAIERILKRQMVIESVIKDFNSEELAKHLIIELIRAAYLQNDKVLEAKIPEIAKIIDKYVRLKEVSLKEISSLFESDVAKVREEVKERNQALNWIISLAACEIEENLGYKEKDQAIASSMFDVLSKNIQLPVDLPYAKDLEIQIYLSIFRKHFKYDRAMLSFVLFRYYNSTWANPSEADLIKISRRFKALHQAIEKQLKHPLIKQMDGIVRRYSLYFSTLTQAIQNNPVNLYNALKKDHKDFVATIKSVCSSTYKKIKSRLWKAGIRSIIYIFVTKSVFVVLIEVPAVQFFGEKFNPLSLGINIVFPAALLFTLILFTRIPRANNTKLIVSGVEEIAFVEKERKNPIILRRPIKRGSAINVIFTILYTATFFATILAVIWLLNQINFNWVSTIIFLFFLALVSFFSARIKKDIREISIENRRDSIFTFIFDFFYMPVAAIGKWLSNGFSKINIFVFILDFIIEAPFKVLIEAAEEWTKYVKEKKEDLI